MSLETTPRATGPLPAPTAGYRVGTPERESTIALLSDALGAQYLTLDEFEDRMAVVAEARTRAELQATVDDLPPDWVRHRGRRARRQRHARIARLGVRIHATAYLLGSLLMIGIWAAVGLTADAWYPWPIWPIAGWGLGVLAHAVPVHLTSPRE